MNKNEYTKPEVEMIELKVEDIMQGSNELPELPLSGINSKGFYSFD